ncbi:hypothetical protein CVT26_011795 [Gymnopilus dilepis]|uniref:G-protein coupled receptors family 1 profile domain-containing protein n=1 Tax=Gymnopilus dilepis TaxID=231916 RepID=A0A409WC84_9AGAR|nr:hypothetical protein CVT26_011795 [Gymnopilus dilepis]
MPNRIGELSNGVQLLFLRTCAALSTIGLTGCSILLGIAMISKSVHRHSTWFGFIFSWIVSSVSYLLLFFAGQLENLNPPFNLCLTQAALIYSAPPLTAASTLSLIVQVYFNICDIICNQMRRKEDVRSMILVVAPYFLHAAVTTGCLVLGLKIPSTVQREDLETPYCNMVNRVPSKIASISVVLMLVPTLCLEVLILRKLRKHWTIFRNQKISLSTTLRVTIFSFFGALAVVISLIFASTKDRSPELNVIISSCTLSHFLTVLANYMISSTQYPW